MSGLRCCVVGASGFIGRNLVGALAGRPDLQSLTVALRRQAFNPFVNTEQVDVRYADLEEIDTLLQAVADSEVVFHLASGTVPSTSNENPVHDVEVNLNGSLRLLDACRQAGVKRVVFVSSGGTVYGRLKECVVREDHPTFPLCSYGIVKLAIERYLHLYHELHGLDYTILRASNPYGPFQPTTGLQGAVPVFISKMLRQEQIEIWGDGSVVRDFLYIDDLVHALVLAARMPRGCSAIYNVGSGKGTSLNDLVSSLASVANRQITPLYRPGRAYDVPHSVLDISKICAELKWKPRLTLEEGLSKTLHWFKEKTPLTSLNLIHKL